MLTGVRPDQHGILSNASGPPDPALSYWSAKKIKVQTLYQCAGQARLTSAAVNWPVTVDAALTWNLPEVYASRSGDSSDMKTVARYATPGLIDEIGGAYPSFHQQWLDDRSRTLAAIFLLTRKHPDLMLLHLAELDSESHAQGPFGTNAKAVLERSDELIGDILKALPKDYDLALVSDHGFEAVDSIANLKVMAAADGVTGALQVAGGLVTTGDAKVADWLRAQSGKEVVGREVPHGELMTYAPQLSDAVAAFEPAPHVMFGAADSGAAHAVPKSKGDHGFWPLRPDYHSIFLLSGPGIKPGKSGDAGNGFTGRPGWRNRSVLPVTNERAKSGGVLDHVTHRRNHIHPDIDHMVVATQDDAPDRRDIAIVAAPGGGDMPVADDHGIGGIEIDPAERRRPYREPGMAGVRPDQPRHARRRMGEQIARHIARRQSDAAHRGDADMGKVLTDASTDLEHLIHRCGGIRDGGVVAKIGMDAVHQLHRARKQRPRRRENFAAHRRRCRS